jgi:hypothetical protein
MWQILKAEFEYYKTELLVAYGLALLFFIVALLWLKTNAGVLISFTSITFIFACIVMTVNYESEKRIRLHSVLPVPPIALGVIDVLFVALFQLGMCLLWVAFPLLQTGQIDAPSLPEMLVGLASMQGAAAVFMINAHLPFIGKRNYQWVTFAVFLIIGATLVALHYAGHFWPVMRFLGELLKSLAGALLLVLIWLSLSALSVKLFALRKSFLA